MTELTLQMTGITKHFPGIVANDKIDFELKKGEIHALLGENGAGKTTLMNILYGLIQPDKGSIKVKGKEVNIHSPMDALNHGIGMVHQHFMLVPTLTALENIMLGEEPKKGPFLDYKKANEIIKKISENYEIGIDLHKYIWQLSVGEQQRVEIIKTLYRGAEILILDEPTAVLSPPEVETIYSMLDRIINQGKSVVFITHKLKEVMHVSDRVTILRQGKYQGTLNTKETDERTLARLLVGRDIAYSITREEREPSTSSMILLEHVEVPGDFGKPAVKDLSLGVRAGEIVGVAGVDGNGQSELVEAIVGLRNITKGKLFLENQEMTNRPIWKRTESGIRYVPADRKTKGVALDAPLSSNAVIKSHQHPPFSNRGIMDYPVINQYTTQLIDNFKIVCNRADSNAQTLSGGNLQKLILARETDGQPKILVIEHPTRGLDLASTVFIRELIIKLRDAGTAVLLFSADLDEVISVSDRIVVMYEGEILLELDSNEIDMEIIGLAMAGITEKTKAVEVENE